MPAAATISTLAASRSLSRRLLPSPWPHIPVFAGAPDQSYRYRYDERARAAGLTFVSACGFDSVPADMGALVVAAMFPPGVAPSCIESYLTVDSRAAATLA